METNPTKKDLVKIQRIVELKGKQNYFEIKNFWARIIAVFIALIILFQIVITFFIGFNLLNFDNYKTFLHIVMGENFFQVVGMGYIVANHLFPNKKNETIHQNKISATD
ncbi:MAG: hypothetical protein UW24_C0016G0019 [Parcubacteria group bacterium GW2011_GWA2_44_12]|nr:MAG: hypothetical protein UW24_C0016G0019 [Parcubacteria group bacterium GW2011_GWA2_44_12]